MSNNKNLHDAVIKVICNEQIDIQIDEDAEFENRLIDLIEQLSSLTEISKKTLGSYIKKAADDVDDSSGMAWSQLSRANQAYKKGDEEKADQYDKSFDLNRDHAEKRKAGIAKAVNKLTKEAYGYDDDEDRDVAIANAELKKRKIKLPSVKNIDPDKDLSKLAKTTKQSDIEEKYSFEDYLKAAREEYGDEEAPKMADIAYSRDNK